MDLKPKESLTAQEVEEGLKTVIKDGVATHAMATLTGGVFLVALALSLGASNVVIGLLAAIPFLSQLIQIPSIYLVERVRNRRLVCVSAASLCRTAWLFVALVPFLFSREAGLIAIVCAILFNSAIVPQSS